MKKKYSGTDLLKPIPGKTLNMATGKDEQSNAACLKN